MPFDKASINYSLYLVTDSTPAILGHNDICHIVNEALKGGVTMVQYRDKKSDTGVLISTARRLHEVTKRYSVPLLINDRVDVALAIGCEGVHVGQDDMDLGTARRLLGPDAIIGVSASTQEEALKAIDGGADYLGIGAVFATSTKKDTKHVLGPSGVRHILSRTASAINGQKTAGRRRLGTVCIGGIGQNNVQRVLDQASPAECPLDGVAVVSAIMAAQDPAQAAREMADLVATTPTSFYPLQSQVVDLKSLLADVPELVQAVAAKKPISHNMTNLVVQNFAANVALCIGASPIMSTYAAEAADLAKLGGALVINTGTVTPDGLANYVQAVQAYNLAKRPVVLDPVGAGATSVRREALRTLLDAGYFTVIKGNQSEIFEVLHAHDHHETSSSTTHRAQQRGVDSTPAPGSTAANNSPDALASMVQGLAAREKCVIVMTGATDYVSDGTATVMVKNGDEMLGRITGTGCVLGTTISAYLAAREEDSGRSVLSFVVAAMLHFETAAESAMNWCGSTKEAFIQGPGSFVPVFLDALATIRDDPQLGVQHAKLELWTG